MRGGTDRTRDYDFSARHYDRLFGRMNAGLSRIALKLLALPAGSRILDVACGTGMAVQAYRQAGLDAVGIDRSTAMLGRAATRLPAEAVVEADASAMPFDDGSFDGAVVTLALHEMDPPVRAAVLAEIGRVLRPDAPLVVVDYHHENPEGIKGRAMRVLTFVIEAWAGGAHFRGYRDFMSTRAALGLVERAGWSVDRVKTFSGGNLAAVRVRPPANGLTP